MCNFWTAIHNNIASNWCGDAGVANQKWTPFLVFLWEQSKLKGFGSDGTGLGPVGLVPTRVRILLPAFIFFIGI